MTSSPDVRASEAVVAELTIRFGERFSAAEIEAYVNSAAADLAGSVSAENLPEMAIRLAIVRMRRAGRAVD